MANVGKGKARLEMNVPDGLAARIDALGGRLSQQLPEADLRDRGALLALLVEWAEQSEDLAGEITDARAEVAEAHAEREAALQQRDAALREIAEADQALRRRVDIGAEALDLLAQARDAGVSRGDLVDAARLCLAAGVPPHRIVAGIQESGVPGLLAYADKLGSAVAEAQRTTVALGEEVAARRKALATLQSAAGETEQRAATVVAEAEQRVAAAAAHLEQLQRLLAEVGAYADFLRPQGRLDQMPPLVARVLAGVVLLACVEQHGDTVLRLPAGGPAGRLLDVPVALSEIPYALAPAGAYQKMREAQAARTARARDLAGVPAGGGGSDG